MNEPRTDQPVWISCFVDIMSVGRGDLPSCGLRSRISNLRQFTIVGMGPPPDLQFKFGEDHGLIDIESQDPDIGNLSESASAIDRIRCERVMIAGENDDRTAVVAHHPSGALQQFQRLAMIVKGVARSEDNIGTYISRRSQNLRKHCERVGVAEAVIYAKVQIRAVNDNRFWVRTHDQLIPEQVTSS